MGINGLWDIISRAKKECTFLELATHEGYISKRNGVGALRIGFDLSITLYKVRSTAPNQAIALVILFRQFSRLLAYPSVVPIFVADGGGRPAVKRDTATRRNPESFLRKVIQMIEAFGFGYIEAPGEAEAELAAMCRSGVIDAVVSNDGDCFVFGCPYVISRAKIENGVDLLAVYTLFDIYHYVKLSRGGFLLIALLSGGDYSPGVPGCGPKIAEGLARAGFGNELLNAVLRLKLGDPDWDHFISNWRQRLLEELCTNAHGFLPSRQESLATRFPQDFPDTSILRLYVFPLTSWTTNQNPYTQASTWMPTLPHLSTIVEIASELTKVDDMLDITRFLDRNKFLSGYFARAISLVACDSFLPSETLEALSNIKKLVCVQHGPKVAPSLSLLTLEAQDMSFVVTSLSGLTPKPLSLSTLRVADVPALVATHSLPWLKPKVCPLPRLLYKKALLTSVDFIEMVHGPLDEDVVPSGGRDFPDSDSDSDSDSEENTRKMQEVIDLTEDCSVMAHELVGKVIDLTEDD